MTVCSLASGYQDSAAFWWSHCTKNTGNMWVSYTDIPCKTHYVTTQKAVMTNKGHESPVMQTTDLTLRTELVCLCAGNTDLLLGWLTNNELETMWRKRSWLEVLDWHRHGKKEENHELVENNYILAKKWTGHLLNKSHKCYDLRQLASFHAC